MSTTTTSVKTDKEVVEKNESKPSVGLSGRKIVYDKDGKPCRTCNTLQDFQFVTAGLTPAAAAVAVPVPAKKVEAEPSSPCNTIAGGYSKDYPPDVEVLGKSSWTLLHSIAATYPENPTSKEQQDLKQFVTLFGNFYPCWFCKADFVKYIEKNDPQVNSQDKFGKWLCEAHNEVNVKLGKPKFDCNLWKQRWKDGWDNDK
ncbi:ERV/ALR sulfhydryl oxidase domain-containing protein [Scheffersomyces coipomensis]|uniref:ERV/ALR sulfhydryl oxidase domain-containing protein n=1 Tax=Scheffersomyces coipomensis TaxID=1788519 RepID=UPI00315DA4FE